METNTRAEEVQETRRRRSGDFNGLFLRLGVDEALLDRRNFVYRWINDDKGKIEAKTQQDDWDFVVDTSIKGADGIDTRIRRQVGRTESGPLYAYLCKKRKDYYEEDKAKEADVRRSQRENRILKQDTGARGGVSDDPANTYIPAEVDAAIRSRPRIRKV